MNTSGLTLCMAIQQAHASFRLKFDDELGRRHGIDFSDFVFLDRLARSEGGRASLQECVRPLGLQRSAILRRLLALEKIGLVARSDVDGDRRIVLRPAGRALVNTARETVSWVSGEALAEIGIVPSSAASMQASLSTLADAPVLALS